MGTLCVSDNNPKIFNCVQIQQLEQLAKLVESELQRQEFNDLSTQLEEYQFKLAQTQKITRVRSAILEKVVNAESLHTVLHDIVNAIEAEYTDSSLQYPAIRRWQAEKGCCAFFTRLL